MSNGTVRVDGVEDDDLPIQITIVFVPGSPPATSPSANNTVVVFVKTGGGPDAGFTFVEGGPTCGQPTPDRTPTPERTPTPPPGASTPTPKPGPHSSSTPSALSATTTPKAGATPDTLGALRLPGTGGPASSGGFPWHWLALFALAGGALVLAGWTRYRTGGSLH